MSTRVFCEKPSPAPTSYGNSFDRGREPTDCRIHVPGTRASFYLGRKFVNAGLRHLLNGRCRLSRFARSAIGLKRRPELARTEEFYGGFPVPIPFLEVLFKREEPG